LVAPCGGAWRCTNAIRSIEAAGGFLLAAAIAGAGVAEASTGSIKANLPTKTTTDVQAMISSVNAVVSDLKAFQKLGKSASVGGVAAKLKADESAESTAASVVSADLSGSKPAPAAPTSPSVGTTLNSSDGATVQLIAFGPDPGASNGFLTPKAGNSLVSATVQGCAPTSGPASFNPLYFTLKMKDNTTADAALGEVDGQIDSSDQSPGSCVRGKVGFEVPPGETPSTLVFQVAFSSDSLRWRVG
jgi:hypothetical protein